MNKKVLKLALLDVKIMLQSITFIGGIGVATLFLCLWLLRGPESFNTDRYMNMFFEVMKYVIIVNGIMVLGKQYKNGTYKYLFSGAMTRKQIMYEKVLAITFFGLICGMIQTIVRVVVSIIQNKGVQMNDLLSVNVLCEIWLYIIFALLIGCFGLMMLSITGKVNIAFISGIAIFGIVQFYSMLYMVMLSNMEKLAIWQKAIFFTPNYIIWNWMQQSIPTYVENAVMLGYILLMFMIGLIVIGKKDLNLEQ